MWSLVPQAIWRKFCSFYLLAEPDSTGRLRLAEPDSTHTGTRLLGISAEAVDKGEGCGVWFRSLPRPESQAGCPYRVPNGCLPYLMRRSSNASCIRSWMVRS